MFKTRKGPVHAPKVLHILLVQVEWVSFDHGREGVQGHGIIGLQPIGRIEVTRMQLK